MILSGCGSGRPSHKEILGKLRDALNLVENKRWSPANPGKLLANWEELEEAFGIELALEESADNILLLVLKELKPEHYVGMRPPERSYEKRTLNQELFEFRWNSRCFANSRMYFKFSICGGASAEKRLYVYSLHPNRERGVR